MKVGPRALWWAGGTLGVLLVAVAGAELAGWPFLRQPLQDAMTRGAGVPVVLAGAFRASLIGPPAVQVEHLNVAAAPGPQVPHLLDARQVELRWRWADLWRWRQGEALRLLSLRAALVDAHLVRGADGRATWQIARPPAASASPEQGAAPVLPRFGSLQMDRGLIVVDDRPSDTQLRVQARGGETEAGVDAAAAPAAAASAAGDAAVPTSSGYQARVVGRWRALPLDLNIVSGSSLPLLQDAQGADTGAPDVPLRVEGRAGAASVLFDGHASALLGDRRLQGHLRLRGPSLAQAGQPLGLPLPQSPPFDLRGDLGHAGGLWHLRVERAAIGRSLLRGDFRYDANARPGRLSGRLGGPRLLLGDLAPAVGAGAPRQPPGKLLPQRRFDLPSLRGMDADVRVAIDELDFGSDALEPLRNLRTQLLLDGGVLQLRELQAVVAGGRFSGSTRLDASAEPARWRADLRFSGVDVAGWVKGVRADPAPTVVAGSPPRNPQKQRAAAQQDGAPPVRAYLTGRLGGHLQASGQGRSVAEMLATLDGQAQLMLRDGTVSHLVTELAGLDLAQALGVMVRSDRSLPLRCARVDLVMQNGVARPRLAIMDNADSTVRLAGEVDLRNETLALQARTRPKDFSPLALRTPVHIGGTFASPTVGIEGKRLAGRVLGALALGAVVGPAAALLPLMDPGEPAAGDPCADATKPATGKRP